MEDEIDALFKLPLGEFTPARNALAARLKKAGEQAEASAVKGLPKPAVAAWVVNQLYWRHRKPFDRFIEATQKTRDAPGMRERLEARREAQAELVRIAANVLKEAGSSGTRDLMRRVTSTLEALSTSGSLPDAPQAGRLTAELEPPGFDLFGGVVPTSSGKRREAKARPTPAPKTAVDLEDARHAERRRLAAAAKNDVRDWERALRAARTQAERTAAAFETAAKRAGDSERRRAKAEKQLADVVAEADEARERAREAEAVAQRAAREAESAERALEAARLKLTEL